MKSNDAARSINVEYTLHDETDLDGGAFFNTSATNLGNVSIDILGKNIIGYA